MGIATFTGTGQLPPHSVVCPVFRSGAIAYFVWLPCGMAATAVGSEFDA